jgi:uncharacterized damage-inducible protein DinB
MPDRAPVTSAYVHRLLDYHYWARDRVLAAAGTLTPEQYARPLGSSFPTVRDTLNHVYFAEWIWYRRWQGDSPTGPPGVDLPDATRLRAAWAGQEAALRAFFEGIGEDGLGRVIEYRLLNGQPGAAPLWQMVAHVVNHASYHRGQVTTMLRQLGATPPQSTDLIAFFRERPA